MIIKCITVILIFCVINNSLFLQFKKNNLLHSRPIWRNNTIKIFLNIPLIDTIRIQYIKDAICMWKYPYSIEKFFDSANVYISYMSLDSRKITDRPFSFSNLLFFEGLTEIFYANDSTINGAHILLNPFTSDSLQLTVIIHELGHVLSLEHNKDSNSIMNPIAKKAINSLSSSDYDSLYFLYPNLKNVPNN